VLGVDSEEELKSAYRQLIEVLQKAGPRVKGTDGVYVQRMMPKIDYELILGAKRDKDFGAMIVFGQGGREVEFVQDISMGLPPLNQTLARRMIEETRVYSTLKRSAKKKAPQLMQTLEEIAIRFSNLVVDFPEIAEIEINPLACSEDKVQALDSRAILDTKSVEAPNPYSHLVMFPYPTKYVIPWRLKNGVEVILRPIRPEDEKMEGDFIEELSKEAKKFRFFHIFKKLAHTDLARYCNIDYDREMAIIAELRQGEQRKEIGVARLTVETDGKRGEFAVVVADKYQRKGLGMKLTDTIIEIALDKGLKSIYGIIMPENEGMIRLCRKMGFTLEKTEDGVKATLTLD
ncbi:MAG: GNAT family N-acetyltransferase, partial [Candidatus Bathyarchaeia archaeon]